MDGGVRRVKQQPGRAGEDKVCVKANAKSKVEPSKPSKPAFLPFKKALLLARSLKLKTLKEWKAWRKSDARPTNIPSNPNATYKHGGWRGYAHWLGTV